MLFIINIVFAIIQELVASWDVIRFFSYGLSIVMIFVSFFIEKVCKQKKALAAAIQLEFDLYVYNMPWDKKLFGRNKDLSEVIAEKSKMILENASLLDWYTSVVDQRPPNISLLSLEGWFWR